TGNIEKRAAVRESEICRAAPGYGGLFQQRNRITEDFQTLWIESDGAQCSTGSVNDMAGVHVLCLVAAVDQYFFLAGLEIEHCNLGIFWRLARCAYREEHSASARQNEGEQMVRFPLSRFRRRQYLGFAAGTGHAQKSGH